MLAVVFDGQHDRPSSSRHICRHCRPSTTIDDRRDGLTWWRQFRWPPTLLCSLCTFSFRDLQHFLSVDVGRHYWLDRVFHAASLAPTARFACHESMLLRYNTRCYFKVRSNHGGGYRTEPKTNKKLSYRRGTARRSMSVKTVRNVTQIFVELHLISPTTGEWP